MTASQQIDAFNQFARSIIATEGEEITLEELQDRWWQELHRDEDTAAIQEAVDSYEKGESGRPVDEFLTERRAARTKTGS